MRAVLSGLTPAADVVFSKRIRPLRPHLHERHLPRRYCHLLDMSPEPRE